MGGRRWKVLLVYITTTNPSPGGIQRPILPDYTRRKTQTLVESEAGRSLLRTVLTPGGGSASGQRSIIPDSEKGEVGLTLSQVRMYLVWGR